MSGAPARPASTGRRVLINTGALGTANLWRIVVSFVTQVLIARKLGVSALGDYAVVVAWLNVGQIVTDAGLPTLFVRSAAGRPALQRAWHRHVISLQVPIALAVWAALVVIAAVIPSMRSRLDLLLVGGALLPFYAVFSAGSSLFEAAERMDRVLFVDGLANTLLLVAIVAAAAAGGSVRTLLWITVAAQACAAALSLAIVPHVAPPASAEAAAGLSRRSTLRQALPLFGLTFADVLQQRGDLLLLSMIASPAVTGVYAAANSIVRVAIKLVNAYWRALLPTLGRLHDQAQAAAARLDAWALGLAALGSLPVASFGMVLGASVVALLYGQQPEPIAAATELTLAILLWTVPLYVLEQRAAVLLIVRRRPTLALSLSALHLIVLAGTLPPLALRLGAPGAGWAALIASLAGACAAAWALLHEGVPLRLGQPGRALVAAGGATAVISGLVRLGWGTGPLTSLGLAAAGTLVYLALAWLLGAFSISQLRALRRTIVPEANRGSPTEAPP